MTERDKLIELLEEVGYFESNFVETCRLLRMKTCYNEIVEKGLSGKKI